MCLQVCLSVAESLVSGHLKQSSTAQNALRTGAHELWEEGVREPLRNEQTRENTYCKNAAYYQA